MNESLSIIVPVHNAEARLTRQVHALLELLPELATRFEVLIVDDGSTDQTPEIASELAHQYPQVRAVSRCVRQGLQAATAAGLARASGDVVIVQWSSGLVRGRELTQLWNSRRTTTVPVDRATIGGDAMSDGPAGRQRLREDMPHEHGSATPFQLLRHPGVNRPGTPRQDLPARPPRRPLSVPLASDSSSLVEQSIRTLYS